MKRKLAPKDFSSTIRFYWKYAGNILFKKLWFLWPLWIVMILAQLAEPYVFRLVFDEVGKIGTGGMVDFQMISWYIVWWAVATLISLSIIVWIRTVFGRKMPQMDKQYFDDAMRKVMHLDMAYHLEKKSGEMMKKIDRGTDGLWGMTLNIVVNQAPQLILGIFVLFWALTVNWQMTAVTMIFYPLCIYIFIFGAKTTYKYQEESNNIFTKVLGRAYDAAANIMVVKSFAKEDYERNRVTSSMKKYTDLQEKASVGWGRLDVLQNMFRTLQRILVVAVGVYLMWKGQLSLGELTMFVLFQNYLYAPVFALGNSIRGIQHDLVKLEEAREIMDRPLKIVNVEGAAKLKVTEGKVEMTGVTFKYKDIGVIDNVNLVFEAGQMTALVGHSGAGKSTVTSLINRFYDLHKGRILIDGQDISQVTQESLRANIGVVMQENTLFNDTIYNNIAYANPKVKKTEVYEAAKQANIHDFIISLPDGYKTVVGERGLKLSGGEKQRVAIARVILKNPPILILDEATSALDSKNERIIQQALDRVMQGRTSIVIAHRLSTVIHADKIVVMDKGKVVQQGKHGALKTEQGIYKELVDLQVGGLL
ncbi:ABC transporter ATP-binding protein, partial [Candidatus Peregrinibacteria bacterium]|nr:ABC transporter ATP-binding protein [Candidatus Peregrinibacteria bacterium]